MKLLLIAVALLETSLTAFGQVRAGCTPVSTTLTLQEALSANGLYEWNCTAVNEGSAPATLSVAGFALDFIQLEQLSPAQVTDILTQKVRKSGWGRAAQIAEFGAAGALIVLGQNYVSIGARGVADIGLAAYGFAKAQPLFEAQQPSVSAAIQGMLTADQTLAPGQGFQWKVYAANTGAPIGPQARKFARSVGSTGRAGPLPIGPITLSSPKPQAPLPSRTQNAQPRADTHGWEARAQAPPVFDLNDPTDRLALDWYNEILQNSLVSSNFAR